MNNVTVGNTELGIREWKGQRVVTLADIDAVHKKVKGTASRAFNRYKKYFVDGEDYFVIHPSDIQIGQNVLSENQMGQNVTITKVNPRGTTFLTESGYLMIAKVFTDDKAWEVQRTLVSTYFRTRTAVAASSNTEKEFAELKNQIEFLTKMFQEFSSSSVKSPAAYAKVGLPVWRDRVLKLVDQIARITHKTDKQILSQAYRTIVSQFEPRLNTLYHEHKETIGHHVSMLDSIYWMESENKVEPELLIGMLRIMLCRAAEG